MLAETDAACKARILNPRSRRIGLDLDTLNRQVEEKRRQQIAEKQREAAFDEQRRVYDEVLVQQDREDKERRAEWNRDLAQYWADHQRVEDSRDADLKCDLKGAFTLSVPEAELGPASMQVFQGEGILEPELKRVQSEKLKKDLLTQKEIKERRHMEELHKEMFIEKKLMQQDLRAINLDALELECRKAARIALDNYNNALAAERAEKMRRQQRREEGEGLAEVWHMVTSDMLTESGEAALSTARWKGMSPEQIDAIHKEREQQNQEKQKQRESERLLEAAWDRHYLDHSRLAQEEEEKEAAQRQQRKMQLAQYNRQLAKEQQAHQEYLNKQVYTNQPTADYFSQFHNSRR